MTFRRRHRRSRPVFGRLPSEDEEDTGGDVKLIVDYLPKETQEKCQVVGRLSSEGDTGRDVKLLVDYLPKETREETSGCWWTSFRRRHRRRRPVVGGLPSEGDTALLPSHFRGVC